MTKKAKRVSLLQEAITVQEIYRIMAPGDLWRVIDEETGDVIAGAPIPVELRHRLQGKTPHEMCEILLAHTLGIPVLSPDEARDKYFYEEACKPKGQKLPDRQILAKARREHPEWDCDMTIQNMRKLRDRHQRDNNLPPILKRHYKRS